MAEKHMAMISKFRFIALILLNVVATPIFGVTITFTGVSGSPGELSFDGPLAGQGVIISVTGGPAVVTSAPSSPAMINNSALVVNTAGHNPLAPSRTRIEFMNGAQNQSIALGIWDTESSVSITSFNASGIPIETINLTTISNVLAFSAIGTSAYIIITDTGGDGHIWDNLTFVQSHTPEPSTFFLMGIALAGLIGLRWRRSGSEPGFRSSLNDLQSDEEIVQD
jgi:hypothetical protein